MTVTTSLNLAAIRAGIVAVLNGIPEIIKVNPYPGQVEGVNNLPLAEITRGEIGGRSISLQGEEADTQLGGYDHLITWTISVYASIQTVGQAQELDDLLAGRLFDAFNSNRLIDANGPGVVDSSRIPLIVPLMESEEHAPLWVTTATLQTFVISSL